MQDSLQHPLQILLYGVAACLAACSMCELQVQIMQSLSLRSMSKTQTHKAILMPVLQEQRA